MSGNKGASSFQIITTDGKRFPEKQKAHLLATTFCLFRAIPSPWGPTATHHHRGGKNCAE
ncbi:MAG: hypothetical protein IPL28_08665 [Chloroflexi bacterium]|nr:hypothetical protein [Chloroflexota bacterium]